MHENPLVVSYHFDKRLTEFGIHTFSQPRWKELHDADGRSPLRLLFLFLTGKASREYDRMEREEEMKLSGLVDDLFKIEGITYISIMDYHIKVMKARGFEWSDMEPSITDVFHRHGLRVE